MNEPLGTRTSRLSWIVKLVVGNVLVLLGLLLLLNLAVITFYQTSQWVSASASTERVDKRHELPNYEHHPWAFTHFTEFDQLKTEYESYVGWRRLPYRGQTITIDDNGIRQTSQSPLVSPDAPLVAFLGGSTMWGTGSTDQYTIPSQFGVVSEGAYRSINLGESSYNAYQGFLFLHQQLMKGLRPQVVVSYDGINNLYWDERSFFMNGREQQIRDAVKGQDRLHRDYGSKALSFKHFFWNPLRVFVNRTKRRFQDTANQPVQVSPQKHREAAVELLESWLATKMLADAYGAVFVPVLQPHIYVGKASTDHLPRAVAEGSGNTLKYYPYVFRLLDEPRYRKLKETFLDLTNAFDGEEGIYIDCCHVSPNGNAILARKIRNHLVRIGSAAARN